MRECNVTKLIKELSKQYNIPASIVSDTYNSLIEYESLHEVIQEIKNLAKIINGGIA